MESKVGSVLTLIGGILTLIGSVMFLIVVILIFNFNFLADKVSYKVSPVLLWAIFFIIFIYIFIIGILKVYASNLMKNSETSLRGGIIAVILGILVSDIFSLIGGIFGIVQSSEEKKIQGRQKRNAGSGRVRKKALKKR